MTICRSGARPEHEAMPGRSYRLLALHGDQRGIVLPTTLHHSDVDVDGLLPLQDQRVDPSLYGRGNILGRCGYGKGEAAQHRPLHAANTRARWSVPTPVPSRRRFHPDAGSIPTPVPSRRRFHPDAGSIPTPVPSRRRFHPDAGSIPTPVPCGKAVNPQTSGRRGERRPDVPGATEPERSATGCRHRRVH